MSTRVVGVGVHWRFYPLCGRIFELSIEVVHFFVSDPSMKLQDTSEGCSFARFTGKMFATSDFRLLHFFSISLDIAGIDWVRDKMFSFIFSDLNFSVPRRAKAISDWWINLPTICLEIMIYPMWFLDRKSIIYSPLTPVIVTTLHIWSSVTFSYLDPNFSKVINTWKLGIDNEAKPSWDWKLRRCSFWLKSIVNCEHLKIFILMNGLLIACYC